MGGAGGRPGGIAAAGASVPFFALAISSAVGPIAAGGNCAAGFSCALIRTLTF